MGLWCGGGGPHPLTPSRHTARARRAHRPPALRKIPRTSSRYYEKDGCGKLLSLDDVRVICRPFSPPFHTSRV